MELFRTVFISVAYVAASLLFLLGLRDLTHPTTARRGTTFATYGMALAVLGTLVHHDIVNYLWLVVALIIGTLIGIPMGLKIPMTKMPERIALSHAFGGLAVSLVGVAEYIHRTGAAQSAAAAGGEAHGLDAIHMAAIAFEVLFGAITFTGSLMAFGKLQGFIPSKPVTFPGQNIFTLILFAAAAFLGVAVVMDPSRSTYFYAMLALSYLLGIQFVLPIGGADMPVVICLLNSYAGLAASASGFALNNPVLIICGSLDGGSGFILAIIMSKAMNRSFTNVLFGAFGSEATATKSGSGPTGTMRALSAEDAASVLDAAGSVVIVPGYGLAVSQAQHIVRELATQLEKRGTEVRFGIHPVAGRMPGHMNVLLAEASVPYDKLFEMDEINEGIEGTDVAIVVGANDVVNPAARHDKASPIYGMPIINVDKARNVFVLKRGKGTGFSGLENELFFYPNTSMVYGDAKATLTAMVAELKEK